MWFDTEIMRQIERSNGVQLIRRDRHYPLSSGVVGSIIHLRDNALSSECALLLSHSPPLSAFLKQSDMRTQTLVKSP